MQGLRKHGTRLGSRIYGQIDTAEVFLRDASGHLNQRSELSSLVRLASKDNYIPGIMLLRLDDCFGKGPFALLHAPPDIHLASSNITRLIELWDIDQFSKRSSHSSWLDIFITQSNVGDVEETISSTAQGGGGSFRIGNL